MRLERALGETSFGGIRTNIEFLRRIVAERDFVQGEVHTRWLDEYLERAKVARSGSGESIEEDAAAITAALWHCSHNGAANHATSGANGAAPESRWKSEGRREQLDQIPKRS